MIIRPSKRRKIRCREIAAFEYVHIREEESVVSTPFSLAKTACVEPTRKHLIVRDDNEASRYWTKPFVKRRPQKNTTKSLPVKRQVQQRIGKITQRAEDVFGSIEEAANWLGEPKSLFDGKSPLEYAATQAGAQQVLDILGRIEHGIF